MDSVKVVNIDQFQDGLKVIINKSNRKWVWIENPDGNLVACYVNHIEKIPGRTGNPAHINLELVWQNDINLQWLTFEFYKDSINPHSAIEEETIPSLENEDEEEEITNEEKTPKKTRFKGRSILEILNERGIHLDSTELYKIYAQDIKRMIPLSNLIGTQLTAKGKGLYFESFKDTYRDDWSVRIHQLEQDDIPARLVVDNNSEKHEFQYQSIFYKTSSSGRDAAINGVFWNKTNPIIPIHPYLKVFDLRRHQHAKVHINAITEYHGDKNIRTKLILPATTEQFIDILLNASSRKLEDIIKGKTGGIIVLCTGDPGTGKTLTAEVYAEILNRPLYSVQCSQLGTNEEALEKKIKQVLERATRWNALLLLDEADVYVRERGDDIKQNAIVGVFLRLLEYYSGVMFLTANLKIKIDDAIVSRTTAHLRYTIPEGELLQRIWHVLSNQFKVPLTEKDINILTNKFPKISGRSIKTLLKLTYFTSESQSIKPSAETVIQVSQFLDLGVTDN